MKPTAVRAVRLVDQDEHVLVFVEDRECWPLTDFGDQPAGSELVGLRGWQMLALSCEHDLMLVAAPVPLLQHLDFDENEIGFLASQMCLGCITIPRHPHHLTCKLRRLGQLVLEVDPVRDNDHLEPP